VRYEPKTYTPTPLRTQNEVATLKNKRYQKDTVGQFGYNLHHIDGIGVRTLLQRDQTAFLNPGPHLVIIEASGPSGGGKTKVSFEAKSGVTYETDGRISSDRIEMWIQNADTREIVSDVAVLPLYGSSLPIFWGK
jgi:hypothetical protein